MVALGLRSNRQAVHPYAATFAEELPSKPVAGEQPLAHLQYAQGRGQAAFPALQQVYDAVVPQASLQPVVQTTGNDYCDPQAPMQPATLRTRSNFLPLHFVLEEHLRSLQSYLDGWVSHQERLLGFAFSEFGHHPSSVPARPTTCLWKTDGPGVSQAISLPHPVALHAHLPETTPERHEHEHVKLEIPAAAQGVQAAPLAMSRPPVTTTELHLLQTSEQLGLHCASSQGSVRTQATPSATSRTPATTTDLPVGSVDRTARAPFERIEAKKVATPTNKKLAAIDVEEEEKEGVAKKFPCRLLERIERSIVFQSLCTGVILLNAIFLAVSAEYHIDNLDSEQNQVIFDLELIFVAIYTAELLLRLTVHRIQYFIGNGCVWNWFDFLLVVSGLRDVFESFFMGSDGGGNYSYLRAMRLLKMLKLLRIVRLLRSLRELRLVLDSILGSMRSLMWSLVLITAINYMFGVCFLQGTVEFLRDRGGNAADAEAVEALRESWGSLGSAMLSLLQASTGGADWADKAAPLWEVGIHYYIMFLFYICFFMFVLTNSVTSIVVDGMREFSEKDQASLISEQLSKKQEFMDNIAELYSRMDADGSGEVSWSEFKSYMEHPRIIAFAESLDMEVNDLEQFFGVLSNQGQRPLNLESFVVGCIKLRGIAKSMDVIDVLQSQKQAALDHKKFVSFCEDQFALLHSGRASG